MSAKHRSVQRPAPSAKPRVVVAPSENVTAAMKVLCDLYESEKAAREALERRVAALERRADPYAGTGLDQHNHEWDRIPWMDGHGPTDSGPTDSGPTDSEGAE